MITRSWLLTLPVLLSSPVLVSCRSVSSLRLAGRSAFIVPERHADRNVNKFQPTACSSSSLTQLRAGASILPIAATTTAAATSAFLGVNGVILLTKPDALVKQVYGIQPNEDTAELHTWIMQGIGAFGIGLAIQLYASIVQDVAPFTAMALGLAPRGLFFVYTILSGKMGSLNIQQRFFTVNTVLTCWCITALLLGLGNAPTTSKVYSTMCFLKSTAFVAAPSKVSNKLFGKPSVDGQSKALIRIAGNELMTSAILMMACAWKLVPPIAAAGYVCVAWFLLLADMAFRDKTWRLMGLEGPKVQVVNMAVAGVLGAGFFLAN